MDEVIIVNKVISLVKIGDDWVNGYISLEKSVQLEKVELLDDLLNLVYAYCFLQSIVLSTLIVYREFQHLLFIQLGFTRNKSDHRLKYWMC